MTGCMAWICSLDVLAKIAVFKLQEYVQVCPVGPARPLLSDCIKKCQEVAEVQQDRNRTKWITIWSAVTLKLDMTIVKPNLLAE